jgi:membrane protein DedA with SNARE-associated domain
MFDFITGWIEQGGLLAVGFLMIIENVFPPIPSELIMPLAGFLAAQGSMSMILVVVVGTLGSVLGALFWYWLARAWGRDRFFRFIDRHGVWLTLDREEAEAAMRWFDRYGPVAVLIGRMIPTVRTLIAVPAGLAGMSLWSFVLYATVSGLVWTGLLAGAGYLLEDRYEQVEHWLNPITTGVVVLIVALYLYRLVRGLMKRRG